MIEQNQIESLVICYVLSNWCFILLQSLEILETDIFQNESFDGIFHINDSLEEHFCSIVVAVKCIVQIISLIIG